jgi:hypothetical protein
MYNRVTPVLRRSTVWAEIEQIDRAVGVPNANPTSPESYPTNQQKRTADLLLFRAAMDNIRQAPFAYARLVIWHAAKMWFPTDSLLRFPLFLRLLLLLEGVAAFVLGCAGAAAAMYSRAANADTRYTSIAILLYFVVTLCWFDGEGRHTVAARLLLLVFSSHAIALMLRKMNSSDRKQSIASQAAAA